MLLDEAGKLWITDFGLAWFQEDAGLTMTGDMLGTLRYMSPEQALAKRGYLDHRSDIYSLGVTLYELLTLRPAIEGSDRQELLRKIAQEEPVPPRKHDPAIPRELETILLKAMDKEHYGRYTTAQELADDLRRFLDHRPIRAKRSTFLDRAAKWSRRHTAIVVAALAILAVCVLALLVNTILLGREERRTVAALKLAETQSRFARNAVDKMYTRVAEKWLVDQPSLRPLQREFLEDALAFYKEFARQRGEDQEARIEQAVALRRIGEIQDALNNHGGIEPIYLQVLDLLNDLTDRPVDSPRRREELAAVQSRLARLYLIDGRIEESAALYSQALEIYQALATQYPDRIEYQGERGRCLSGLGSASMYMGRPGEAERLYLGSREVFESLATRQGARAQSTRGLRDANHNLGNLYDAAARFSEAEHCRRRAVELSAQMLMDSPGSLGSKRSYASDIECLAHTLVFQRKWDEAGTTIRDAIRIQEPLAADENDREDLALSLCVLGEVLNNLDRGSEAEKELRRSIELSKHLIARTPRLIYRRFIIAKALLVLADVQAHKGHHEGASKSLVADARSHVKAGLAINPLDPDLNKLNAEIESLMTGKELPETAGVWP